MNNYNTSNIDSISNALPDDVLQAIKSAASFTKIFPVNPGDSFDSQILRVDEIVFSAGGSLTLSRNDFPFIAIVAKRWKFADPNAGSKIELSRGLTARNGEKGGVGRDGFQGTGENDRHGNPGEAGGPGGAGGDGETLHRPHLYLIASDITSPTGDPLPGFLRFSIIGMGVNGGDGGPGGSGGNGGKGANGKQGASAAFDCKEGAGRGGKGGDAGQGGQGGRGANGGNGADITIIGTDDVNEVFSYARILNEGGYGGRAGRSGVPGKVGSGGFGGGSNGWCKSGPSGDSGNYQFPQDLGTRGAGEDGTRGDVTLIGVKTFAPIFD
jgi:hypothetical protein